MFRLALVLVGGILHQGHVDSCLGNALLQDWKKNCSWDLGHR
jgi:hypothetical protein